MTQNDLDVGPIDYLAVEFPGAKLYKARWTPVLD